MISEYNEMQKCSSKHPLLIFTHVLTAAALLRNNRSLPYLFSFLRDSMYHSTERDNAIQRDEKGGEGGDWGVKEKEEEGMLLCVKEGEGGRKRIQGVQGRRRGKGAILPPSIIIRVVR